MSLAKFYALWRQIRFYAVATTIILILLMAIKGHSYAFEAEYAGPGSEAERLNEACRERDNRDAYERCTRGEGNERDYDRAREYERDHGA